MARVSDGEVLLLWRALRSFRSGPRPRCAPRGRPAASACPLYRRCPRDRAAAGHVAVRTVLDLLSPDLARLGA